MGQGNKKCNFHGKGKQLTPPSRHNSRLSSDSIFVFAVIVILSSQGPSFCSSPGPDVPRAITNIISWITAEMPRKHWLNITTKAIIIRPLCFWTRVKMMSADDVFAWSDCWVYSLITPLSYLSSENSWHWVSARQSEEQLSAHNLVSASIHRPYPQETTIPLF